MVDKSGWSGCAIVRALALQLHSHTAPQTHVFVAVLPSLAAALHFTTLRVLIHSGHSVREQILVGLSAGLYGLGAIYVYLGCRAGALAVADIFILL